MRSLQDRLLLGSLPFHNEIIYPQIKPICASLENPQTNLSFYMSLILHFKSTHPT